jgi:hypothetical protein
MDKKTLITLLLSSFDPKSNFARKLQLVLEAILIAVRAMGILQISLQQFYVY